MVFAALVLLGAVCAAGLIGFVYYKETHLPPVGEFDTIIVLGAQVKADGMPSVALERRLTAALEEYRKQPRLMIVCGAQGSDEPRAEDAAKMAAHREQYDAAVSRAVANAATLEELTLPFVKKGGVAIAWKGPGVADELTAARRAAFLLGGTVRGTVDAPIPRRADWAHVLLLTDKTGTTPKAYPRKAGTPGKKPLGM